VPGGFNPSFDFTPGGVNTPQFRFAPESVIDVEMGVKSELTLAGAPAQVTADIFHSDYTNIQRYVSETLLDSPTVRQHEAMIGILVERNPPRFQSVLRDRLRNACTI
jgi:hypothetical protein